MKLSTVKRGDTWSFVFNWKDSNNNPLDLSDCTARMQVRKKKVRTLLAEVSSEDGNITIDGSLGKLSVTFPASMTNLVEPGAHDTDLEITFTSTGEVRSTPTLEITVDEDITR